MGSTMSSTNFSDLTNKNVVVVGGNGLIGQAVCRGFAEVGAHLILADAKKNSAFLQSLRKTNATVDFVSFDITSEKKVTTTIATIIATHGPIDVFINCSWPRTADWSLNVETVPYSSVKKNLTDHLGGYYHCTQQVAMHMKLQKKGSIINFGSIYGVVGPTFPIYEGTNMSSPSAYALIKGGIIMMTKYMASYFGPYGVRVNCVSPGGVYRNEPEEFVKKYAKLTPLGRMATADDLVMPVLFLASDGSRYVTGHNLLVDGGWTIH